MDGPNTAIATQRASAGRPVTTEKCGHKESGSQYLSGSRQGTCMPASYSAAAAASSYSTSSSSVSSSSSSSSSSPIFVPALHRTFLHLPVADDRLTSNHSFHHIPSLANPHTLALFQSPNQIPLIHLPAPLTYDALEEPTPQKRGPPPYSRPTRIHFSSRFAFSHRRSAPTTTARNSSSSSSSSSSPSYPH